MIRIGIDLGGTNIAVGAVDDSHTIVSRVSVPTLAHRPAAEVVGDMGDAVEAALAKAGLSIGGCRSIGIGSPGTCNSAAGVVERAYNLGWDHVPVCRMLEERFHVPCRLSNDANCAALAEQVAGAAVGHDNVVLITLGTGVGGGILTGGHLLEGARGLGGELGHYRTHALDGVDCTCGAKGCWERYAATTALVRAAQEKDPDWKDGRAIFAAAEAGNETVLALLDAWTDEIAQGLAGMVHIFNPQLILIGGGVSAQQKLLIEPIAAKVKASVMPAFAEGLEVRAAQLHNDAGMVGAVYYFRQTMEKE